MGFDLSEALKSFGIEKVTPWAICEMIVVFSALCGLVTYGVKKLLRVWKTLSDADDEAKRAIGQMADNLRPSGSTLGGRTDLGFFVILQLDDLRAGVAHARFFAVCYFLLAIMFSVPTGGTHLDIAGLQLLWSVLKVVNALFGLVCVFVGMGFFAVAERYGRYIDAYVSKVKRIWNEALMANKAKRAKRSSE